MNEVTFLIAVCYIACSVAFGILIGRIIDHGTEDK